MENIPRENVEEKIITDGKRLNKLVLADDELHHIIKSRRETVQLKNTFFSSNFNLNNPTKFVNEKKNEIKSIDPDLKQQLLSN